MRVRMLSQGLKSLRIAAVVAGLAATTQAKAEILSGAALVTALRQGGYVLLVRHASSPPAPPVAGAAEPDNPGLDRQLDDKGKSAARAMGAAIKALRLPIGEVWSSPTYRARETVRLAALPTPRTTAELGDGGASMKATAPSQTAWLRAKAAEVPRAGTDTMIVTQYPNIQGAFGQTATGLSDGETLVFRPDGKAAGALVGRIKIEDWPVLAGLR